MHERTSWRRGLLLLPAAALAVTWACRYPPPVKRGPPAKGSPPSCFGGADPTTLSVATIQARIESRGIHFDSVWGAADSAQVDFVKGEFGRGEWAWIEPEDSAWYIDSTALMQGCIIARIRSSKPGGSFGPWEGGTWWWVDKKGANGTEWRSFFIPANAKSLATLSAHIMYLRLHPGHVWNQSIARFKSGSVAGWGVCSDYCCEAQMQ